MNIEHVCEFKRLKYIKVPTCGGTYVCAICKEEVGWCVGACDAEDIFFGGICDHCWHDLYVPGEP